MAEVNGRARNVSISWAPLLVVLALVILIDLLAAIFPADPSGDSSYVILGSVVGLLFGQVVFTAVCTTLLPIHWVTRVILGALGTLLIAGALGLFVRNTREEIVFIFAAAVMCQWVIYQIPLWSFVAKGWQLKLASPELRDGNREVRDDISVGPGADDEASRFGIRHIFVWTTIVAVLVACAKFFAWLATDVAGFNTVDWIVFAILALGNSVLALPLMWGAFVRRVWLWLIGAVAWVVILTPVQILTMMTSLPVLRTEEIWIFVCLNTMQLVVGAALLMMLRLAGLRLSRTSFADSADQ